MSLVSPTVALVLLGIFLLATLFITLRTSPQSYDQSRTFVFMSVLAGLGVIITFFFYYGVVELNEEQHRLAVVQETARISNILVEELMSEIVEAGKVVPNFAASVTPLQIYPQKTPDPESPEATFTKLFLSYKIFSIWQDLLIADEFIANEPLSYITSFLQRANSRPLYYVWIRNKIDFNSQTQEFGDLLFEYALPITDQRPEIYVETAKKFLTDPRYKAIRSQSS